MRIRSEQTLFGIAVTLMVGLVSVQELRQVDPANPNT
jgi:hypothetical protein